MRAGTVRSIGCPNLAARQLMKALAISRGQQLDAAGKPAVEYPAWMEAMPGDHLPHELRRDDDN